MAKAFFRFLRGELNGFYITNLYGTLNRTTQDVKEFFIQFAKTQMEEGKISPETLYNLGKFAGIYLPRIAKSEAISSVRMTESEYDEELQYEFSERGLYKPQDESFEFVQKVIDDTGLPDINTLATEEKRSSLVGEETIEGYISENAEDVLDDNGNVRPSAISATPPSEGAYSDFYGNQFLFLAEGDIEYSPIAYELFLDLFKAIQYVRYNGSTILALGRIMSILCPNGLARLVSVAVSENKTKFIVSYETDINADLNFKQDRLSLLLYITKMKFPLVEMVEAL